MGSSDQIGQLSALSFKMQSGNKNSPREKSGEIPENEMPYAGKQIPQEGTYNKYGGGARKIEIGAIKTWGFYENAFSEIPECIFGNTGCRILNRRGICLRRKNNPIPDGRAEASAYVGENRKLDARFRVKGFQVFAETNASGPTIQLQGIRALIDVISYRKWNLRATGVSRAFSTSGL